jgi:hypothetical protein
VVTGASSCSAAFGVASDAMLKKQNAAAIKKCSTSFDRDFISSFPVKYRLDFCCYFPGWRKLIGSFQ